MNLHIDWMSATPPNGKGNEFPKEEWHRKRANPFFKSSKLNAWLWSMLTDSGDTGITANTLKGAGTGGGQTTRRRVSEDYKKPPPRGRVGGGGEMRTRILPVLEAAEVEFGCPFPFPMCRRYQEPFYLQRSHHKKWNTQEENILRRFCVKYLLSWEVGKKK